MFFIPNETNCGTSAVTNFGLIPTGSTIYPETNDAAGLSSAISSALSVDKIVELVSDCNITSK